IEMDYGRGEQFKMHLNDGAAEIQLPDGCKTDEKWFVSKFRVVADLRELTELKTIRFVEEYEKKETKSEAAPLPEAKDAKADVKPATPAETKPRKKATATKPKPTRRAAKGEAAAPREKAPEEL